MHDMLLLQGLLRDLRHRQGRSGKATVACKAAAGWPSQYLELLSELIAWLESVGASTYEKEEHSRAVIERISYVAPDRAVFVIHTIRL